MKPDTGRIGKLEYHGKVEPRQPGSLPKLPVTGSGNDWLQVSLAVHPHGCFFDYQYSFRMIPRILMNTYHDAL